MTHGHTDHIGAVATHANLRHLYGLAGATYHVHTDTAPVLTELFRLHETLCGTALPHTVRGFATGGASYGPRWFAVTARSR